MPCSESLFLQHDEVSCLTFSTKHICSWVVDQAIKSTNFILHSPSPIRISVLLYGHESICIWVIAEQMFLERGSPQVCNCPPVKAVFKVWVWGRDPYCHTLSITSAFSRVLTSLCSVPMFSMP